MGITAHPNPEILGIDSQPEIGSEDLAPGTDAIVFSEGSARSCVGIIDIIESTRITSRLNRHQIGRFYSLFINWAASVVKAYGGNVVKNTGDGLLFYFPLNENSDDSKAIKNSLNCCIKLSMLHPSINNKFRAEALPELNYRISLDYGEVAFANTLDNSRPDIFSVTVNVCSKINSLAAANTVVVGGDMYQISKGLGGYSFEEAKMPFAIANKVYPVYRLTESKSVIKQLRSIRNGYHVITEDKEVSPERVVRVV